MTRTLHRAGVAVLVASGMIACKSSNNNSMESAAAQGPASAMGDSGTIGHDTLGGAGAADTTKTAPTGLNDASILGKELSGDSAEVAIAKYMIANGTNASVKAYARLLDHDHSQSMMDVRTVAKKTSLTPQTPPNDTSAQETAHTLDHLKSLNGKDRDTAFVNHEAQDHQSDIADVQQAEQAALNPQVKALLQKSLPELQKHLDRAQKLQGELGAPSGGTNKK